MRTPAVLRALRATASAALSILLVVGATHVRHVNHTTVALLLVLLILGVSMRWGWLEALVTSLAGGIGFDYFFLRSPSLNLEAPEYLVSLGAFLLTAVVTGQLFARAASARREAERQRDEVAKLDRLGNAVTGMEMEDIEVSLQRIPSQVTAIFGAEAAAFFDLASGRTFFAGAAMTCLSEDRLRSVAADGRPLIEDRERCCVVPVRRDGRLVASLGIAGVCLTQPTAAAIAERVGVALAKAYTARQTVAAELARRSENLKSAVLDALAHEIKGPLATVKVSVSTLLSNSPGTVPQQRELLEIIGEECDRIERWINSATEVSRSEAGQLHPEKKPNSLREVARRALEGLGPLAGGRLIEMHVPDSLPTAQFDADMVEKVIRLVVENALKYSPLSSPVSISSEFTGAELVLSISDRGPGVPERERERIFEPYYRGQRAQAATQGTGLGLSSARCIMQSHGGEIWVTDAPGGGSVFHISLPVTMNTADVEPESLERGR